MPWTNLVHLGDIALTVPTAAVMTAWLVSARAWRMAFWWSLFFTLAIALVGASKIAFLGWGTSLPWLGFQALSGHATGFTAVFPTLLYLLLQKRTRQARMRGVGAGLALGVLMALLLVALDEHTVAEALAGWAIGALVSVGGIRLAGELPRYRPRCSLACFALLFLAAVLLMKSLPLGWWMIKAALLLSGNERPYDWESQE